ncbi:hypothetical protein ACFY0B_25780 [Streptomyces sp. NPDC001797]|uniref:hypothetical protein n=1 Tax=Streptomyces sp. NPDC001797 TaxID=3364610 RepID=UPI003680E8D8
MKRLLELLGFLALAQGVLGLVHEFTHWRVGVLRRLAFLDAYGVYASVALIVLACALFAATGSRRAGGG